MIVDTHPVMSEGISQVIKNHHTLSTEYHTNNVRNALDIIKSENIDLIITEVTLEESSGLDLIRRAKSCDFKGKILCYSHGSYLQYSTVVKKLGADGYINKSENKMVLMDALMSVLNGYRVFKVMDESNDNVSLSNREVVVFDYLIKGYSNKKISEILSLSNKTISTYKKRILDKYQVNNVIDIVSMP